MSLIVCRAERGSGMSVTPNGCPCSVPMSPCYSSTLVQVLHRPSDTSAERRRNPTTGVAYPWIVPATAMVNQFYVYALDADFGPFFIKFGSYFPYTGRVCLNGHEYAKRQAAHGRDRVHRAGQRIRRARRPR